MGWEAASAIVAIVVSVMTLVWAAYQNKYTAKKDYVDDLRDRLEECEKRVRECEQEREKLFYENVRLMRKLMQADIPLDDDDGDDKPQRKKKTRMEQT